MHLEGVDPAKPALGSSVPFPISLQIKDAGEDDLPSIQTIRDLPELEGLRPAWESWPGSRDSDLEFFTRMVRWRGRGCRPHVIVLKRNARPDVMLIGLREHRKLRFRLGQFTICQPEVNVMEFVYGGLRGNVCPENCAALIREVIRSLHAKEADLALWKQLDVESPLYSCARQLPHFALRDHFPQLDDHWWRMNVPNGLEALFMSLGRNQRSKLQRKYKHVLDHFAGEVRVCAFGSPPGLERAISDMEAIASKTDKRRVFGGGFFDTPQIREQMKVLAEKGWLRVYLLYVKENPVAFWMGTLYNRCLQGDYAGYDPAWARLSPGIFLFLYILEDLRTEDIRTIDLGYGNIRFKQCFGDMRKLQSRVHIFAPTPRGILLNLLLTATRYTTDRTRALLQSTHSLEWARRLSRNHIARQRPIEDRVTD